MDVFIIQTSRGKDLVTLNREFSDLGCSIVIGRNEGGTQDLQPMTYISPNQAIDDQLYLKMQHITAWDKLISSNMKEAVIVLDTVRVWSDFALNTPKPLDWDICIFSPPNLQLRGSIITSTKWVRYESNDPTFNNIFNAYGITLSAAKKLYNNRNSILNSIESFNRCMQEFIDSTSSNSLVMYGSFVPSSSKPIHVEKS